MSEAPHRACRLTVKLEGDDRAAIVNGLLMLAQQLDRGELTTGVTGGPDSGCIYEYVEGAEPTHNEYFARVRSYLAEAA